MSNRIFRTLLCTESLVVSLGPPKRVLLQRYNPIDAPCELMSRSSSARLKYSKTTLFDFTFGSDAL